MGDVYQQGLRFQWDLDKQLSHLLNGV